MHILIDSKETLDRFAEKTAKFTKIPKSRLKSAIAKGQGFDHILPLEESLRPFSAADSETKEATSEHRDTLIAGRALARACDDIIQCTLAAAHVDSLEDINMEHYEQAEDAVTSTASLLADVSREELSAAIDAISKSGCHRVADLFEALVVNAKMFEVTIKHA
jgi:hypothetical protein